MSSEKPKSHITFIDGENGVLRYRGYTIEQLAEQSNFPETSWLVPFGELPTSDQLDQWHRELAGCALLHENIRELVKAFRYDAHPMGTFISTVAALSTFYPESRNVHDAGEVQQLYNFWQDAAGHAAFGHARLTRRFNSTTRQKVN